MAKRDRASAPLPFNPSWPIAGVLLLGSLTGCAQPLPEQAAITAFSGAVTRQIQEHSEFGFSEAEIYLTRLASIPNDEVYEFGDRVCETLRRGGSSQQIAAAIQSQFSYDDERMTYLHIAQAAEQTLCPQSSFPAEGWQRSLFFWQERLNGGQSL